MYSINAKGKLKSLLDLKNIDICKFLAATSEGAYSRFLKAFKNMLLNNGMVPKCPILKNDRHIFNMINMDYKAFPYLPKIDFKLAILMNLNNVPSSCHINVTGAVLNLNKEL